MLFPKLWPSGGGVLLSLATTMRPIKPGMATWGSFEAALRDEGLPTEDLLVDGQDFFDFAGGRAYGGLAMFGPVALLRSIVVSRERRGRGEGGSVVQALVEAAKRRGALEAWLLTIGAQNVFARQGFSTVSRELTPGPIAKSLQFSMLCPASAVVMCRKPL